MTAAAVGSATITATVEGTTASAAITVIEGGWITPAGGQVVAALGNVVLDFPAGAVAAATAITVAPVAAPPGAAAIVPGTAYDFGPTVAQFAQPVTVKLKDAAGSEPGGTNPLIFKVRRWNGQSWAGLAGGGSTDVGTRTTTGRTSSFSRYAIGLGGLPIDVASAALDPLAASLNTGQTRLLTSTFRDGNGNALPGLNGPSRDARGWHHDRVPHA